MYQLLFRAVVPTAAEIRVDVDSAADVEVVCFEPSGRASDDSEPPRLASTTVDWATPGDQLSRHRGTRGTGIIYQTRH